jgi:hypothetical protein
LVTLNKPPQKSPGDDLGPDILNEFEPQAGVVAGWVTLAVQFIVPLLVKPAGIVIVNVTVLVVGVSTAAKLNGVKLAIVPFVALPILIWPLLETCWPKSAAVAQLKVEVELLDCTKFALHSTVLPTLLNPAGAVKSKYRVTVLSLPVLFAE